MLQIVYYSGSLALTIQTCLYSTDDRTSHSAVPTFEPFHQNTVKI